MSISVRGMESYLTLWLTDGWSGAGFFVTILADPSISNQSYARHYQNYFSLGCIHWIQKWLLRVLSKCFHSTCILFVIPEFFKYIDYSFTKIRYRCRPVKFSYFSMRTSRRHVNIFNFILMKLIFYHWKIEWFGHVK